MELKTTEVINKIARIDSEVLSKILLRLYEATYSLYCELDDVEELEWEETLKKLDLKDSEFFIKLLLEHLGFSKDDEIADGIITKYVDSTETNRMIAMKKELMEWAIEIEE